MTAPVLVIGAGPAGMAIAACLKREGVAFDLVDRGGATGGAYRHIHPELTLTSPTRYTPLPALPDVAPGEYVTAGEYRAYLDRYAREQALQPRAAEVLEVRRAGRGFAVKFAPDATQQHDAVVVATGMYDHPRWPDIPGLRDANDAPVLHSRDWKGPAAHRGQHVLVLGAATSAVEIAEAHARAGECVTIAARHARVNAMAQRFLGRDLHDYAVLVEYLPRWLLGSYCDRRPTLPATAIDFTALHRAGKIAVVPALARLEGRRAVLTDGSALEVDAVIVATGYDFATPFLPPEVARATGGGHPLADGGESRSWPGLYFVGFPCARSFASEFLRGIASDAPAIARRIASSMK